MHEHFPQEIVEHVIDQMVVGNAERDEDRREWFYASSRGETHWQGKMTITYKDEPRRLSASAMVSRSWVQRSRHHHFASLDFGRRDAAEISEKLAAFVDIIRSPLSTVNLHVTEIRLDYAAELPEADVMALAVLSNVVSVSLEDTLSRERAGHEDASLTQPHYITALLEHFTHLKHLKLSHIQVNSFKQLVEIISASDALETLSIERVILTIDPLTWDGILENLPPPPPALRSLRIFYPRSRIYTLLYLWLQSPTSLLIDTLDLCDHANHPQNIPSLLKSSGSSLEHLTIRHVRTEPDDLLPSYNLSHNSRLKSVTLHWNLVYEVPADIIAADSVRLCNTIKQISSPVIEAITLVISSNTYTIPLMNLAEMDWCLQRPNFASLKSESVRLETGYCAENHDYKAGKVILEWLHATFPKSLARGIIHSGFSHDDQYGV